MTKEAAARIKINKLLEAADWRFFADASGPANIRLEPSATIKSTDLDALGDNFEKSGRGFVDFLFRVDRLELEDQAKKAFAALLSADFQAVIYKENREVFDKPDGYCTLAKLRRAAALDCRPTLREILEKVFDLIPRFKSKDELLEEEFSKFVAEAKPEDAIAVPAIKTFFKAYMSSDQLRGIIDSRDYTALASHPMFWSRDSKAVPAKYRALVPAYVKDCVSLNQFSA